MTTGHLVGFAIAFAPALLAMLLSARLSRKSVEEWQLLAWVPLPLFVWWIYFFIAVVRDPTSHNLWPFELAVWMLVSAALFAAFAPARRLASNTRSPRKRT